MFAFLSQCASPEHLQHNPGVTGTAGSSVTGVAGGGGTAAPAGAAGDGSISGTAGDTSTGVAGTTGAAGSLTGTAGAGTAGAGTAGAGTAGAAGAGTAGAGTAGAGTAGTKGTAGAGTAGAGTAGAGTAGAGTAGAGTAGAGTAGAGTAGAGTAGAGTAGAGTAGAGPPVDGCNHVNWTFTPQLICDPATNGNCNFMASARDPAGAIDGDTTTRYTDGKTQTGGEFVTLAFGSTIKLSGVTLIANPATDGAKAYKAEYSTDGTTFVAFAPAVAGTGGLASLPINFPAATLMKALKITQTGATVAPATSWWSINEITLNGCIDQ